MPTSGFVGRASRTRVVETLSWLVDTPSVNPALAPGVDEALIAGKIRAELSNLALDALVDPVVGDRGNVLAELPGRASDRLLVLEAHMDTVAPSGNAQTKAVVRDGRVHGRGACDTKGSIAAMLEAIRLLLDRRPDRHPTVLFAGTIDEEAGCRGAKALLERRSKIDLALVGEPTRMEVGIAHKGVLRFRIHTEGTAAHASRPELGVNAIYEMGRVLDAIERELIPALRQHSHALVGPPSMAVTRISGGVASNVVPPSCSIEIDRRLMPGETGAQAVAAVDELLNQLSGRGVHARREAPFVETLPLDTPPDHPLVTAMRAARKAVLGRDHQPIGLPYGSDASFFAEARIPTIVFGPGDIAVAHTDDEWVEIEDVARAAEIIATLAVNLESGGHN